MSDYINREDGFFQPKDYEGCRNCKYQPEPLRMCEYGENRDFIEIVCSKWEKKMTDYIKHKEYKLPNGRTVTADFNELGCAMVTIQALDALFDILNSSDAVEVVRCKDCIHTATPGIKDKVLIGRYECKMLHMYARPNDYCSYGERKIVDDTDKPTENDFCSYGERAES